MARIRSVHPEQWNDEEFCTLSMAARLLALGMRNFADDNGAFEWKPLRMKMRVFPADSIDVVPLFDELEHSGLIRRYEIGGTTYGLIRNFRRFQRTKSPTGSYPSPVEWVSSSEMAEFVGASISEGIPKWFGRGSERVPKTSGNLPAEGVGRGRGIGEKKEKPRSSGDEHGPLFEQFWSAYPRKVAKKAAVKAFAKLKHVGDVMPAILAALDRDAKSHTWLKDGGEFIPHAATWLNGERWLDGTSPTPQGVIDNPLADLMSGAI